MAVQCLWVPADTSDAALGCAAYAGMEWVKGSSLDQSERIVHTRRCKLLL
jgi:hypothetical protein